MTSPSPGIVQIEAFEKPPRSAEFLLPQSDFTTAVIPAKAGIHFDFSPSGAAATLLLCDGRMRNPENSPFVFVFDSASPHPEVKTSERGGEKAKAKMDSGFRRNDEQSGLGQVATCPYRPFYLANRATTGGQDNHRGLSLRNLLRFESKS